MLIPCPFLSLFITVCAFIPLSLFSTNSWSNKGQRNYYRYVHNHFHCLIWSQLLFVLSMSCPCIRHVTLLFLPVINKTFLIFLTQRHQSSLMQMILNPLEFWEALQSMQSWWMQTPGPKCGVSFAVSSIKLHLWLNL